VRTGRPTILNSLNERKVVTNTVNLWGDIIIKTNGNEEFYSEFIERQTKTLETGVTSYAGHFASKIFPNKQYPERCPNLRPLEMNTNDSSTTCLSITTMHFTMQMQ